MPVYEYVCPVCGKVSEEYHSIKEIETTIVPCDCMDEDGLPICMVRKTSNKSGFKFKGGSPTKSRCPY